MHKNMFKQGLFLITLLLFAIAVGIVISSFVYKGDSEIAGVETQISPAETNLEEDKTNSYAKVDEVKSPVRLYIPKLEIDADIESVGLDQEKRMDVPKEDMNVAWYNLGAKPGEVGSAVLAGHMDTATGKPAVFYEIKNLEIGDELMVSDRDGSAYWFKVTDKRTYKDADFPIPLVFERNDLARLNLITCAGRFDQGSRNYSDRLVVFTRLMRKENAKI